MKRFWLFAWTGTAYDNFAKGGMHDFQGSFHTREQAYAHYKKLAMGDSWSWDYDILDTEDIPEKIMELPEPLRLCDRCDGDKEILEHRAGCVSDTYTGSCPLCLAVSSPCPACKGMGKQPVPKER